MPGWSSWLATLLLVNQPGLLDVLPTYCGLIAITPLVLGELAKGRKWRLLAITILWWAATNYFDPPRPTVIGVINTGAFNFGAWQLLYVIGVMAGHAWLRGTLPDWRPGRVTVAALVLAVVFFSACSHHWLTLGLSHDTWFALTNKNNLAPVRLLNVGVLVLLGHLCLRGRRDVGARGGSLRRGRRGTPLRSAARPRRTRGWPAPCPRRPTGGARRGRRGCPAPRGR